MILCIIDGPIAAKACWVGLLYFAQQKQNNN